MSSEHPLRNPSLDAQRLQTLGHPLSIEELELVPMRPQEFRLIGRFVSLSFQEWKWVGLVLHFTKDAMVMCNALRMTREYFDGPFKGIENTSIAGPTTEGPSRAERAPEERTATPQPSGQTTEDGAAPPTVGGSEAVAVPPPQGEQREPTPSTPATDPFAQPPARPSVPVETPKLVPFVTFFRKDLQGVQYAADHGKVHKCFRHGTREMPHEQMLRAFIRRYIVHTAASNNPHRIYLLDFVRSRCKSQMPTPELVERLGKEELADLVKLDEDVMARRERAQAARQANVVAGAPVMSRADGGRELLYGVGVPSRTSYVAIAHLAIAITALLYAASAYSSAEKNLIYDFVSGMIPWTLTTAALMLLVGAATGFHGLNMTIPITKKVPFFLRLVILICGSGLLLSAIVGTTLIAFTGFDPTKSKTLSDFYTDQLDTAAGQSAICGFSSKFRCSGYSTSCARDRSQSVCLAACISSLQLFDRTCDTFLLTEVKSAMLPIAVIFYLAMLAVLADWYMWSRFFRFGRIIIAAYGVDFFGNRASASGGPARRRNNAAQA